MVELLIALAIGSIVSLAFYSTFTVSQRTLRTENVNVVAQQKVRLVVGMIGRDIRAAGLDPADTDNFGIEQAENTKIIFTTDSIDPNTGVYNGVVDDINLERNGYELIGTELYEVLYEGSVNEIKILLVENIENFQFTYFDANDNVLTPPLSAEERADIQKVQILIALKEPNSVDDPVSRSLTKVVECRNMAFD